MVHCVEKKLFEKVRGELGLIEDKCLKVISVELFNGTERWNRGELGNMGKMLLHREEICKRSRVRNKVKRRRAGRENRSRFSILKVTFRS